MDKMVEIAKHLETKGYKHCSYGNDAGEKNFLCNREGELLFQYGSSYDASRDLERSKAQVGKSLEKIQRERQVEQQRVHEKQMDLGL